MGESDVRVRCAGPPCESDAREALAAVVVHRAFFARTTVIALLTSHVHETNHASMHVLLACRFVETGRRIATCTATRIDVPAIEFEPRRG